MKLVESTPVAVSATFPSGRAHLEQCLVTRIRRRGSSRLARKPRPDRRCRHLGGTERGAARVGGAAGHDVARSVEPTSGSTTADAASTATRERREAEQSEASAWRTGSGATREQRPGEERSKAPRRERRGFLACLHHQSTRQCLTEHPLPCYPRTAVSDSASVLPDSSPGRRSPRSERRETRAKRESRSGERGTE
jgi:hypothetical protein